jgi:hypothetical protein
MGLRVYTVHLPSFLSGDATPVLVKGFPGAFSRHDLGAASARIEAWRCCVVLAVGVIADFIA